MRTFLAESRRGQLSAPTVDVLAAEVFWYQRAETRHKLRVELGLEVSVLTQISCRPL